MDSIVVKDAEVPFEQEKENESAYMESVLQAGFKFKPKDEELCLDFLAKKIANQPLPHYLIKSVNLYNYDPDSLTRMYKKQHQQQTDSDGEIVDNWYFFTPREKRYKNGKRPNRFAGPGFWRATTGDTNIRRRSDKMEVVGKKKKLGYFIGKPGGKGKRGAKKTNWIMEEFVLVSPPSDHQTHTTNDNNMVLDEWVLCKIYQHKRHQENHQQQQHSIDNGLSPLSPSSANDQDHHHQEPLNNGYCHIEPNVQSSTTLTSSFDCQPTASSTDDQAPTSTQIIQANQDPWNLDWDFDDEHKVDLDELLKILNEC